MRFKDIPSSSAGRWLRLKNENDECYIAFVLNPDDEDLGAVFYGQHWPEGGGLPSLCTGHGCELCASGNKASWRMAVTVLNLDTNEKQILDGFPAMWFTDLQDMLKEYDWQETGFKIKRKGQKAQTRRPLMPKPLTDEQKVALKMESPFSAAELMPRPQQARSSEATHDDPLDPGPDDDDMPF